MEIFDCFDSPVGRLLLGEENGKITRISFVHNVIPFLTEESNAMAKLKKELSDYFRGRRKRFTVSLCPAGTDFQKKVWAALREIPYGETVSYGEIAERIGSPKAARAVGSACNRNPIAVVIPCHRVVGARGDMVGYGGGLNVKSYLLDMERLCK